MSKQIFIVMLFSLYYYNNIFIVPTPDKFPLYKSHHNFTVKEAKEIIGEIWDKIDLDEYKYIFIY